MVRKEVVKTEENSSSDVSHDEEYNLNLFEEDDLESLKE